MKRCRALAVLAAVALATGCGGSSPGRRPGVSGAWASPAELRWLRDVGVWESDFGSLVRRVPANARDWNLTAALLPLTHCGDLLRSAAGPPPTARLRRAYVLFERSCAQWHKAGTAALASHGKAGPSLHRAVLLLQQADALLPPAELRPLPHGDASETESRIVPLLTRVASTLARHRAVVRCWSRADWPKLVREEREYSVSRVDQRAVGITSLSSRRINIHPAICATLERLAAHERVPVERASFAVQVLAHESEHASGIASESAADCFGMQTIARTTQLLGLSPVYGERLAADYWRRWPSLPSVYRSPQCHDGGGLDLHPASHTWP